MTQHYDLIVIGGGIHGVGVARDATLRGLSVVLLEKGDLGGATSSSTSKLVHGGIRYLETLNLSLVREALAERSTLLRVAPHLVWPCPFLLPFYAGEGRPRWYMEAGLHIYDKLAGDQRIGEFRSLSADEALQLEPELPADGLKGAGLYLDAQMSDARLCLENGLDAAALGAEILVHHEVVGLSHADDAWRIKATDSLMPDRPAVGGHS